MGSFSLVHWIVLAVVAILLLGGGRFSNMMGDVAKGIKQFKKGMAEDDDAKDVLKDAKRDGGRLEVKTAAEPAFDVDGNRTRDGVREER
ncbi:MAG: twin-arginine translocase TatA/TatE family subunit [Pseudomonadota bacterium]